ncbi:MAG: SMC-Scp complex subunit ScpB [Oligoflexales bacterium]|nr:SMC-Scp complex subunit ScpB [Oligoflexales bacterium]
MKEFDLEKVHFPDLDKKADSHQVPSFTDLELEKSLPCLSEDETEEVLDGDVENNKDDDSLSFYDKFLISHIDRAKVRSEIEDTSEKPRQSRMLSFGYEMDLDLQVEAIIFASPKPVKAAEIFELLNDENQIYSIKEIEMALKRISRFFNQRNGGFILANEKGAGYQFQTISSVSKLMEKMFSTRPRPLSRAALETLAIIAYRQPSTRADVEYIRGVDSGSIIKNLLDRNLISCVGRKEDSGRPMLFGTTDDFLRVFKLNNISELPPLSSFQASREVMLKANMMIENNFEVDVDEFISEGVRERIIAVEEESKSHSVIDLINNNEPISLENNEDNCRKSDTIEREGSGEASPELFDNIKEKKKNNSDGQKKLKRIEGAVSSLEKGELVTCIDSGEQVGTDEVEDPFWELELFEKRVSKKRGSFENTTLPNKEIEPTEYIEK